MHEGDRASEANVEVWLGGLEAMCGNFDEARAYIERARRTYQDLGLRAAVFDNCGRALAAIELLAGSPAHAEELLQDSCRQLQESRHTAVLATRAAELAVVIFEQGRYDDAAAWVRVAHRSAGADDLDAALSRQPVEARILARDGALTDAERLARETVSLVSRTDGLIRHAEALLALAEILELADRQSEAETALRDTLALYEQKGNLVAADRVRARLADATAPLGE